MVIHLLGFLTIGMGLYLGGIRLSSPYYWLVMLGVSVVYLNA